MGDTETKKRSLESTTIRNSPKLLLHCVDGCVPYLNPNQLEEHFPPSENTDLWLGLAVRDACVMPIFQSPNDNNKKKKNKKKQTNSNNNNINNTINKVRGYTFCPTPPDPWLLPYTRFTVPAFDLHTETNSSSTSKNTNNTVHVWTPHGRQKLTAELYATAALEGLQSQHTVSLFDDVDQEEDYSMRRKQKADSRNQEWYKHLQESSASRTNDAQKSLLWKPILLTPNIEEESKPDAESAKPASEPKAEKETTFKAVTTPLPDPSGLAFVGRWRSDLQLNTILDNTLLEKVPLKAMLTTHSLLEILEISTKGIANVIGTNLPQKWAKDKLALGLDLSILTSGKEKDTKRQKIDESNEKDDTIVTLNQDGCMDLSDKKYARDPRPLVPGCDSFVCLDNRFSRAYIHHLVVAKEMVAEILLFGHNLHCLLKLVRCFDGDDESQREAVKESILEQITNGQK